MCTVPGCVYTAKNTPKGLYIAQEPHLLLRQQSPLRLLTTSLPQTCGNSLLFRHTDSEFIIGYNYYCEIEYIIHTFPTLLLTTIIITIVR